MYIVSVPPILHVPNQLVGVTLNQRVTLLCISEAYPKSINYWTKKNGEMILPSNTVFSTNDKVFFLICFCAWL